MTHEVTVRLGERSYPILIGRGVLTGSAERLHDLLGRGRAAVVADEAVWRLYGASLADVLPEAPVVTVPSGEASKSFEQLERVCEALLDAGVARDGVVVAFGGGVVGDLAGFAAAILRRGCRLVQIPTTLLAQVDSSVGGKTAINARAGKNLVGAFHQPELVLIDTDLLASLPDRELRAGYAEIVKYGLLGDEGFAAWLEENGAAVRSRDPGALTHAITFSCEAKAAVVAADEREGGQRALLNLGHTFGHAVETAYGYDGRVLHGEGVGVGMAMAYRYGVVHHGCPETDARRAERLIAEGGLPTRLSDLPPAPGLAPGPMLSAMWQDKKVLGGEMTLILPRALGRAEVVRGVPEADIAAFLEGEAP